LSYKKMSNIKGIYLLILPEKNLTTGPTITYMCLTNPISDPSIHQLFFMMIETSNQFGVELVYNRLSIIIEVGGRFRLMSCVKVAFHITMCSTASIRRYRVSSDDMMILHEC
jgi:hypothetical protein